MADPHQAHSHQQAPSPSLQNPPAEVAVEEDSDPDFDDLDDVLDQFSQNAPPTQSKPAPTASGPGRPETTSSLPTTADNPTVIPSDIPVPTGKEKDETEEEFLARLTSEMSTMMTKMSAEPSAAAATPEDLAKMGQELEEFTQRMEQEGVTPEQMLRALLGDETGRRVSESAKEERERRESESQSKSRDRNPILAEISSTSSSKAAATTAAGTGSDKKATASFEDTIRRTMERMEDSSTKATNAAHQQSNSEEDMLAEMLRALESDGGGDEGDLSKMFLGMMEQLTNKDMLYEPMAELNTKFPEWLSKNKKTLKQEDFERYSRQKVIVRDIVNKFEEKNYSDDDPKCREYIWEKMQKMQEEGAPPEDLISNPLPGVGMPGLGGGGGADGPDEGCPTQ